MPARVARTHIRVRYAETDQMGVAYYANYFIWMEVARVAYCREAGFEYRDMEREGGAYLVVSEAHCRYRAPARFDEEVELVCWLSESRSRSVRFAYQMRRGDVLLATGETLHTVTDVQGRMMRLPERYRAFLPLTRRGARARAPEGPCGPRLR